MKQYITGVPNLSSRLWFAFLRQIEKKTDVLFIIRPEEAHETLNAAESLFSIFPENVAKPELCMWETDEAQKAAALKTLCSHDRRVCFHIISEETMGETFPDRFAYESMTLRLEQGREYSRNFITGKLSEHGYERVYFVEDRGEYAVRGSVLDVYPVAGDKPVRLFFDDDRLSAIRCFEIDTQHTSGFIEMLEIPPRNFGDIRRPFVSFLNKDFFAVSEYEIKFDAESIPNLYITSDLPGELVGQTENFGARKNISFGLSPENLSSEIRKLRKEGYDIHFFCINKGEAGRMSQILQGHSLGGEIKPEFGYISEGFVYEHQKIALITASEYLNRHYPFSRATRQEHKKFFKWSDLKPGDYVVHEDYGIARYKGLKKVYYRTADGSKMEDSDCLYLEYARGDTLFVPLDDFTKVQKFISSEGKTPHLSHMDTKTWGELKHRVREEVREMAGSILRLEAERALCNTKPFEYGGELEELFVEGFPYAATPDQDKAIRDVLKDMEGSVPMNRLLAGDVGFGKTEVAMRAAMRAVVNGAQVAVIAPTTILANQHYNNFVERFAGLPVRIRELSRFVPKKDQKRYLKELEEGSVDIIIGTHRLLQKDVKFFNLGLMAVDEEHRFGVKAKDMIKEKAKGVHCLLMSATPIPRTLYQSLSELKSLSVIDTPPAGRQSVATFVRPFSGQDAASAVAYELARGGQVYYVHNRVHSIESRCAYLKKIMPELRIAVVHGKLDSESVSEAMRDFLDKKYDVLLATTIIESGIDIPNVNTLIVENAHELGLAQMYQLRGRIGRGKRKAFCYLYYPSWIKPEKYSKGNDIGSEHTEKEITEDAARRLKAIEEFTALGSGFRLAMRDLEIRGAGDLLGLRQHGFINSVGLEMYIQLLNGEINRLKGKVPKDDIPDPKLDIIISAFIPENYITDDMERLNYYKKILNASKKELPDILSELEDLAGPAPLPVRNLFRVADLKKRLGKAGVRSAGQVKENLEVFFRRNVVINPETIKFWARTYGSSLSFIPSTEGDGLRFKNVSRPMEVLETFLKLSEGKI